MKKITFWVVVMLSALQLQAQGNNDRYTTEVDKKLENIDKTAISSNILLDRVLSISSILNFNQGTRQDTTSYQHFKQVWYELNRASYIKNFASLEKFEEELRYKKYAKNTIPIGIINTEFHYGDAGTATNPNIQFNRSAQTFSAIPGKNLFVKKQTTIIAPLRNKVIGNTVQFKTDSFFRLYKFGKRIKNLQLFTNGTSFNLISNYTLTGSTFTTTYPNEGLKTLRFFVRFEDNTTKTTYGKVSVSASTLHLQKHTALLPIWADDDLLFQGYDETQTYRGKNEYRIYYDTKNGDKTLNKPLIILDGFDHGDKRKIDKTDVGHNKDTKSIIELMSFDHDNNSATENKDLVGDLQEKGYDVIIVNHPEYWIGNGSVTWRGKYVDGGSDYIERNAYVLISLIRKLKAQQQGTEKMVVIGPSMGGLISRYSLAYMEKKHAETGLEKWNHNTRLWVSFDSPHQGANVPIGIQYWLRFHSFNAAAKENLDKKLNVPAAKQMLVHHHLSGSKTPKGAPDFRDRFQNSLDNLGMPKNLRKIALNNGSLMGGKHWHSKPRNFKHKN